ncbi:uncharacterized protein F4812DRAFT_466485 [Daldinia caldariorum]|uniref:uncharacterized protein n=1 Tax=Daldinia caldariorum TaxID=326644 RepID=UPI002008425D|nr:uncharacterized protein F4812DRAFT_466485 [Daldinia caldariorum]KAI1465513.1 hypothetical protein F4812DRAFT_466485 [Daldinia caldariorum]
MADPEPVTMEDISPRSPHANPAVGDERHQNASSVGNNSDGNHENPVAVNIELLHEIKTIQQRLVELQKKARPKLTKKALEEEWERAREELGPETEKESWKEEKQRRKAALLFGSRLQQGGDWSPEYDDEFSYNVKLFKFRKLWEHKVVAGLSSDEEENQSDSDYSTNPEDVEAEQDYLDGQLFFETRILKAIHEMEMRKLRAKLIKIRQRGDVLEGPVLHMDMEAEVKMVKIVKMDARSEMIRVSWDQFKALQSQKGELSAAIDILIGEPVIEFSLRNSNRRWPVARARKAETTETHEKKSASKLETASNDSPMPERVRINSRSLLHILRKIGKSGKTDFSASSLVLLRPFRVLAYYSQAIRDQYRNLENKFKENPTEQDLLSAHSRTLPGSTNVPNVVDETAQKSSSLETSSERGEAEEEKEEDDNLNSPIAFEHMKCLVEFMDNDIQTRIDYLESNKCQKVFSSDLWYLFQPGTLVIGNDGKQAYRVLSMHSVGHQVIDPLWRWYKLSKKEEEEEKASITIKCVCIDFDGKQLGPVSKVFQIPRFEREKPVTSLEVCPLRFYKYGKAGTAEGNTNPGNDFKKHLISRGKKFLDVAAVRLAAIRPMYYAGPALQTQDEIESQVVVDFEAAFGIEDNITKGWRPELETLIKSEDDNKEDSGGKKCQADCCLSETVHDDSYVEVKRNKEFMDHLLPKTREEMPSVTIIPRPLDTREPGAELTEDDLAIMSYRVFGFVLRNRKWAQLDLTYLSEVQPSEMRDESDIPNQDPEQPKTVFDQLVLPDKHKDMILSLVTQHFRDKESSHTGEADIVRGKGKGLILLLHGAPGVGKTSTAEGVAEKFKKPLFQLTCGDLGTTAKDVEYALETNFALASRWGCILLLDEADVFLAQRTKEDFQRNGLVAVFLRVLEYYSGILFLTTNRVGDFDEAFASRIHISLYYPELGRDETLEVFKLNLQLIRGRFKDKPRKFIPDKMGIGAFAREYWNDNPFDHWNGRQIRNACQTALALAEYEAHGKNHMRILNPNGEIRLNVTHFQVVAEAYLAFSKHLKDIYGTHAARRAKEAGLRAMWVNEKGELMGSVGPKEAGVFKADKKSRYQFRSQAKHSTNTYEQPRQATPPNNQGLTYHGVQRSTQSGGQGYMNSSLPAQPHPTRPTEAYYGEGSMPQRYNNPNTQLQGQIMVPQHYQGQNWDTDSPGYDDNYLQPGSIGRGTYPQQRDHHDTQHIKSQGGSFSQPPQTSRASPSVYAPQYQEPQAGASMEHAQHTNYTGEFGR